MTAGRLYVKPKYTLVVKQQIEVQFSWDSPQVGGQFKAVSTFPKTCRFQTNGGGSVLRVIAGSPTDSVHRQFRR
ncbi:hypothetical protein IGS68_06790 [Skermanella sp. TT6]|uniref:Uncharacterized protein n=1 Tax=Skermanella cutis TaxID=2775420 RepID=A0ABX7B978_9PROT|nr:hypothetical protein [Skermanella sp. TT6]QQP90924.1 hypothetical protein IGS68_06790 [Skermanella sp. TT6]